MSEALPKYLEQTQVKAILELAYATLFRDGVAFELTYFYGLRVSELVRLVRTDYKVSSKRLKINRSKGSVSGEVHVSAHLRPKIEKYLASRRDSIPELIAGRQGGMSTRRIQLLFDRYAQAAGVTLNDGQGVHCLRHSIAVHLLESKWDIVDVQKHLGHRRISSTQVYAQISDRRRQERIDALGGEDGRVVMV